jgi:hypothetical protein
MLKGPSGLQTTPGNKPFREAFAGTPGLLYCYRTPPADTSLSSLQSGATWRGRKFSSWLASVCKANHSTCGIGCGWKHSYSNAVLCQNVKAEDQQVSRDFIVFVTRPKLLFPILSATQQRELAVDLPGSSVRSQLLVGLVAKNVWLGRNKTKATKGKP